MRQTRILLIDDDADHRRLILLSLIQGNPALNVTVSDSREEMLRAARETPFDCIVMDFHIPPHTAPELIEEVRAIQPETPILVISSSHEQQVVIDALRHGVADFVKKEDAINSDRLKERIDSVIEESRRQRKERREANRRLSSLTQQANTDQLTGLCNRRAGLQTLNSERSRHDRREQTAVILLDIDHFKSINDNHGHAAGDEALRAVAGILRSNAEPSDAIIRWGGEEFLVLRASASLTSAWGWADRLRREIESTPIHVTQGRSVSVTASIGVDVVPTSELNEDIVTRADRAMYLAKESGRNRICTWRMVEAMEIAEELQTDPELTPRERLKTLLRRLSGCLGRVQLEHTGPHGLRVRRLAERLGRSIGLGEEALEELALASEFHDIGKVAAPEALLAAPRKLEPAERRFIDEHAGFGAMLIAACGAPDPVCEAVALHHQFFLDDDNRTTPDEPPSMYTILAVADSLVAMMSDRGYTERKSTPQALSELRHERGRQFHPAVVDAAHFIDHQTLSYA
ncbi:MAG: diguanylate cyclase [Phycisphaeraceae bacterium]|nr:diguanylate cyclase [Phycisphaeraceae bacterium]MCB9848827.1 diguanylate cyclase [Phycisphaeraceae bacterium]